jgi:2-dehydro-3-deoxygalactonokinase
MDALRLIAIDWGTSSFRAWAMTAAGEVLDGRDLPCGILSIEGGDFDAAFESAVGDWLNAAPDTPVIASGMITSRNGWLETPYLAMPADAAALAGALVSLMTRRGRAVHFVTGLARDAESGLPDVMRGEETELVGHVAAGGCDGLYVLPGTHSKWARIAGGAIIDFETYMTGEMFAVLLEHSILGRLAVQGVPSQAAFGEGVRVGGRDGLSILSAAFSARTLPLFGRLPGADVAEYLSGLLIGAEVAAGLARHGARGSAPVTVIGRGDLARRYTAALSAAGAEVILAEPGRARRGLVAIARRAGMI